VQVRHGGQNHHPFVEAKGETSECVASVIRQHFEHVPSRIDSALDLRGPTAFEQLRKLAHQFEAQRGLKLDYAGADPENPDRGTTIYLGSRTSQAFVRVYQKGLKHAEEMGLAGDAIPDELRHWVRVELEYKPDKRPARLIAAQLSPSSLWGCSPWTRDFAKLALSIEAEKVKMSETRETNHDRAMRYLVQQYGPTIMRQVELLGSWDRFAEDLRDRVEVHLEVEPA
jgi:DNA relaxase NicK